jgi:hypothetical protein
VEFLFFTQGFKAYKINAEFCLANHHQRHDDKIMGFDYSINVKDGG